MMALYSSSLFLYFNQNIGGEQQIMAFESIYFSYYGIRLLHIIRLLLSEIYPQFWKIAKFSSFKL